MKTRDLTKNNKLPDFEVTELNLSRSSTLVSDDEFFTDDLSQKPTNFYTSFLQNYRPNQALVNEKFEDVELKASWPEGGDRIESAAEHLQRLFTNGWIWEFFSWCMSALCISGIALVLGLYNNKSVPASWPLGITLNAYISVLSAVAKYALAVPVDEALGQLRWLYFARRPKRLIDFERFDDATRGPWGALALLVYTKAKTLASLGASITLLSLALDPFFQQLVTYPQRPSTMQRGQVPRSVLYSTNTGRFKDPMSIPVMAPDLELYTAAGQFMMQSAEFPKSTIQPFCAGSNCEWPVFETLGICSECKDISPLLQFGCLEEDGYWRNDFNYSQPAPTNRTFFSCGYFFNASSPSPMLMTGYATNSSTNNATAGQALISRVLNFRDPRTEQHYWDQSLNFKEIIDPIINLAVATVPDASAAYLNVTPVAHECVLYWCTKTISANYQEGKYSERVLSTFRNKTIRTNPLTYKLESNTINYDYLSNVTITPDGQSETFVVANETALQTIFTFDQLIPLYVTQTNRSATTLLRTHNDMNTTERARSLEYPENQWASNDIPQHMDDLATTITNAIRTYPGSSELVLGSGSMESYIHIRWRWLILPIILLSSTLVFLVATIIRSRRENIGVFKTSSLALLANGLDDASRRELRSQTLYGIFDNACHVKVALKLDEGRVGLKLA
ncbi:hypothetical protein EJ08DRAFT_206013 [Tothia fuscella]|uniref:DUF3176 domain containing protein n=1 Tax=Tothia fuscella TaxID=1048955 RepID=A0A9P4TZ42_9PEZI|nr:hypothetical protein EJ08DRAFT_206013 [Tothia fuscella]